MRRRAISGETQWRPVQFGDVTRYQQLKGAAYVTTTAEDRELNQLIQLAGKFQWATGDQRRTLERANVRLSRPDFYSETPSLEEIEGSFEYREAIPFADETIFDLARIAAFGEDLVQHASSFDPPEHSEAGFAWSNSQFSYADAMALYAIIRKFRPQTVLEIGSGYSSMVSDRALADSGVGRLVCIDPMPRADISSLGAEIIRAPVQSVSVEYILDLVKPGDIVFYDGSHTVKTGSDTVYFYLKVLPRLPSGVLVHCHDIRLPYPQPEQYLTAQKINWSEQYLLLAHLQNIHRYEVLFASFLLHRQAPQVLGRLMHGRWPHGGASLWFSVR